MLAQLTLLLAASLPFFIKGHPLSCEASASLSASNGASASASASLSGLAGAPPHTCTCGKPWRKGGGGGATSELVSNAASTPPPSASASASASHAASASHPSASASASNGGGVAGSASQGAGASASQSAGAGGSQGVGASVSQSAGAGASQSAAAGASQSAGAGASQSAGAGASQGAGASASQSAGAGASSAGAGASQSAGTGASQSAGAGASQSAGASASHSASAASPSTSGSASTGGGNGLVVAHFMAGNCAPYTAADWQKDVALASSKGLDGFIINLGSDGYQPDQVAAAFEAAKNTTNFYIGFSFDMTVMPCAGAGDAALLQKYLHDYADHPNRLQFDGKMLVSTFSGENCTFGAGSLDEGWKATVKGDGMPPVHFVPAFFGEPANAGSLSVTDGLFAWDSSWPRTADNITWDLDQKYIDAASGKTYIAAVSPWFYTHYSPETYNKNWIYNFDNWLWSSRWELVIQNRDKAPIVEVITWNDYGESHYVGPIEGAQPNSQAWVDGFDHQGWLDIMQYYIAWYKTGNPPTIDKDRIFLWAKLFKTDATATGDPVGPPRDAQFASDTLWAQFHLTDKADLTLTCGDSSQTFSEVPAGVSKQKLALTNDCKVSAKISRGGADVVSFAPEGMEFKTNPDKYNFNAFVAASPESGSA